MKGLRFTCLLLVLLGLTFLSGCSTTRLVASWKDESMQVKLQKPMILALAKQQVVRNKIEDDLVRALQGIGIQAVQSYTVIPGVQYVKPDDVRAILPKTGCDSVLVIRVEEVRTDTAYVAPPPAPAFSSFSGYYGQYYTPYSTGYNYEYNTYVLESNLFDVASEKLRWQAKTTTEDPRDVQSAVNDFVKVIMDDIRKNRVF